MSIVNFIRNTVVFVVPGVFGVSIYNTLVIIIFCNIILFRHVYKNTVVVFLKKRTQIEISLSDKTNSRSFIINGPYQGINRNRSYNSIDFE